MQAIVVYESLWGNTAAIAEAIAEGLGAGGRALSTLDASAAVIAEADLVIAGSPVLGFSLPTEQIRRGIETNPGNPPRPPDLSRPSLRSWLALLRPGTGFFSAFETRFWWSPGGATAAIEQGMKRAGYRPLAKSQRFIVTGKFGPLREGEVERARQWGAELARVYEDTAKPVTV